METSITLLAPKFTAIIVVSFDDFIWILIKYIKKVFEWQQSRFYDSFHINEENQYDLKIT